VEWGRRWRRHGAERRRSSWSGLDRWRDVDDGDPQRDHDQSYGERFVCGVSEATGGPGRVAAEVSGGSASEFCYDSEVAKVVLDEMASEAGIRVYYFAHAAHVLRMKRGGA